MWSVIALAGAVLLHGVVVAWERSSIGRALVELDRRRLAMDEKRAAADDASERAQEALRMIFDNAEVDESANFALIDRVVRVLLDDDRRYAHFVDDREGAGLGWKTPASRVIALDHERPKPSDDG